MEKQIKCIFIIYIFRGFNADLGPKTQRFNKPTFQYVITVIFEVGQLLEKLKQHSRDFRQKSTGTVYNVTVSSGLQRKPKTQSQQQKDIHHYHILTEQAVILSANVRKCGMLDVVRVGDLAENTFGSGPTLYQSRALLF